MTRVRRAITAVLLALTFAACHDAAGPASPDFGLVISDPALSPGSGTTTPHYLLRHAATAPTLSAYEVSFWAKRGQERSVTVRYGNGGSTFVTFTVPRLGLERGLDGRRLSLGDSVLITMQLDPSDFQMDFAPSGLQFSTKYPATLRVWYGFMDPDVDRDGDVDADDEALLASGISYYHYDSGGINWRKTASVQDAVNQTITAAVGGFSGYAVSW